MSERNFCERCGKRIAQNEWDIHTCTPPAPKRPQNCGTGHCSCIECVMEPAQRKPLHIGEETAAFKAWFDAWWIGDGEQGETIPTQSDKHFLTYLDQYTLGFGAWMAAKHAAHGIKKDTA